LTTETFDARTVRAWMQGMDPTLDDHSPTWVLRHATDDPEKGGGAGLGPPLRRPETQPVVRLRADVIAVRVGRSPDPLGSCPSITRPGKAATTIPTN
jgi:hypothetical protein